VFAYEPRRIKKAIAGNGAADKSQVRQMIMALLALKEEPQEDAGDALAIAVCHLHNQTSFAALEPKPI
jgi:crossover junction endodeoxyribonuclease RuvC